MDDSGDKPKDMTTSLAVPTDDVHALVRAEADLIKRNLTARQIIDLLIQVSGGFESELTGQPSLHIPLNNVHSLSELPDIARHLKPTFDKIFGANNIVTYGNGMSGHISVNIPLMYLQSLEEEQCKELLEGLRPAIMHNMELGREKEALEALVGAKFTLKRVMMNEQRTHYGSDGQYVYEILQKTFGDPAKMGVIDPLDTGVDGKFLDREETTKRRNKAYRKPLSKMAGVLNQIVGDPQCFKSTWHDNGFLMLHVREADVDKLFTPEHYTKVQEVFRDPLAHCKEDAVRKILAAGSHRALPYKTAEQEPVPPEHPEEGKHTEGKPNWRDAFRKAFAPGGENATGTGHGV